MSLDPCKPVYLSQYAAAGIAAGKVVFPHASSARTGWTPTESSQLAKRSIGFGSQLA
jgi:hypothetical protein